MLSRQSGLGGSFGTCPCSGQKVKGSGQCCSRRPGKVLIQVPGRYWSALSRRLPPVSVAGWKKGNLLILYHGHWTGVEGGRKLSFQRSPSDSRGNFGAQTGALAASRGSHARRSTGRRSTGRPTVAAETQETPPSEGPGGWALGTLHTVILDVENTSSVT